MQFDKLEFNKSLIEWYILFFISFCWFFYLFSLFFSSSSIDDTYYSLYVDKSFEKVEFNSLKVENKVKNQNKEEDKSNELKDKIQERRNLALIRYKEYIEKQKQLRDNFSLKEIVKYELNPDSFFIDDKWKEILSVISTILKSDFFLKKIDGVLTVSLYKEAFEVRWRYKNKNIFLFDLDKLSLGETISVFIHEYWHFFDLVLLSPKYRKEFYDLSWESSNVIKTWIKSSSFVSWYAMTNKYEDFAETFLYFVMHNKAFEKRAFNDDILKKKYDFFSKRVFKNGQFNNTFFSKDEKLDNIKDYYWDITKIDVNLKKFLDFLKSWV